MNDVINREDAIDAVLGIGHTAKLNDGDTVVRMSAVNYVLRNLPSAQPVGASMHDSNTDYAHGFADGYKNGLKDAQQEIVQCKECKHHWTHRCMDSMPTEICELGQTFYDANVDFCSLAERRTDE